MVIRIYEYKGLLYCNDKIKLYLSIKTGKKRTAEAETIITRSYNYRI